MRRYDPKVSKVFWGIAAACWMAWMALGLSSCGARGTLLTSQAPAGGLTAANTFSNLEIRAQSNSTWQNFSFPAMSGAFQFDFDSIPSANGINAVTALSS